MAAEYVFLLGDRKSMVVGPSLKSSGTKCFGVHVPEDGNVIIYNYDWSSG